MASPAVSSNPLSRRQRRKARHASSSPAAAATAAAATNSGTDGRRSKAGRRRGGVTRTGIPSPPSAGDLGVKAGGGAAAGSVMCHAPGDGRDGGSGGGGEASRPRDAEGVQRSSGVASGGERCAEPAGEACGGAAAACSGHTPPKGDTEKTLRGGGGGGGSCAETVAIGDRSNDVRGRSIIDGSLSSGDGSDCSGGSGGGVQEGATTDTAPVSPASSADGGFPRLSPWSMGEYDASSPGRARSKGCCSEASGASLHSAAVAERSEEEEETGRPLEEVVPAAIGALDVGDGDGGGGENDADVVEAMVPPEQAATEADGGGVATVSVAAAAATTAAAAAQPGGGEHQGRLIDMVGPGNEKGEALISASKDPPCDNNVESPRSLPTSPPLPQPAPSPHPAMPPYNPVGSFFDPPIDLDSVIEIVRGIDGGGGGGGDSETTKRLVRALRLGRVDVKMMLRLTRYFAFGKAVEVLEARGVKYAGPLPSLRESPRCFSSGEGITSLLRKVSLNTPAGKRFSLFFSCGLDPCAQLITGSLIHNDARTGTGTGNGDGAKGKRTRGKTDAAAKASATAASTAVIYGEECERVGRPAGPGDAVNGRGAKVLSVTDWAGVYGECKESLLYVWVYG